MNNNLETLNLDNYKLSEINLDNFNIPSVVPNNKDFQVSQSDNNITEININFERDNDIQDGGDFSYSGLRAAKGDTSDLIQTDSDFIDIKETEQVYNNKEILEQINLGDILEIHQSSNLSEKGLLIYLDNKHLELKREDKKRVFFKIENQEIENVTKVNILQKSNYSHLIQLYNLNVNSIIKLLSKNENHNNMIGKIIKIDNNRISILVNDNEIELDLTYGMSYYGDNEIYDFEIINEIDEELEDEEEIEIIEDLDIVMDYEIKEENVICTLEEGHTCLISSLMKLFNYQKNIEKKEVLVSKIVNNLLDQINNNKSDAYDDKPGVKKLFNGNFLNSNIIPIVSLKKKKI